MGMPDHVKKLHKETNQDLIDDEIEAIDGYERAIEESDNPDAIDTYEHIKNEEEEHIAELRGLDKMKAEDITSEEAWNDFKAGYTDFEEKHTKSVTKGRDGDQASLEEKIDTLSAKISELNTDMSRLTDSVPQALGTIEEGKTLEEEAKDKEEGEVLEDEEGGLFDDDDGLDEFFADNGDSDEEDAGGSDVGGSEDDSSLDDSEEEVVEESSDENGELEESDDGESDEAVDENSEDEDFIPIGDVMSDDESEEEVVEDKKDEDEEEVIEKMVRILERLDKRVSHLERENAGLRKQLSERMKVQTEATNNVAKSRPRPNTDLKLVKGSYNRPPVSTQYVANQRDIGNGMRKESPVGTSVFRKGLNEVFENCERIANQTNY